MRSINIISQGSQHKGKSGRISEKIFFRKVREFVESQGKSGNFALTRIFQPPCTRHFKIKLCLKATKSWENQEIISELAAGNPDKCCILEIQVWIIYEFSSLDLYGCLRFYFHHENICVQSIVSLLCYFICFLSLVNIMFNIILIYCPLNKFDIKLKSFFTDSFGKKNRKTQLPQQRVLWVLKSLSSLFR